MPALDGRADVKCPEDKKRMLSSCPDPEFLAIYLDGELSPAEKGLVESHLTDCRICRAVVSIAIKSEEPVTLPDDTEES